MKLTPEILLEAYSAGIFPMAESAASPTLHWYDPARRGILPLDARFHVPRRLARTIRQTPWQIRFDTAFEAVMRGCAAAVEGREGTWINEEILALYTALHRQGHAHSLEVWDGEALIGGLYGLHLGAAFFGESMFSRRREASKIALVHLVCHLRKQGFLLLDTQYLTPHLAQFGALEIPRATYKSLLAEALQGIVRFRF